jgi:hypothetical protein
MHCNGWPETICKMWQLARCLATTWTLWLRNIWVRVACRLVAGVVSPRFFVSAQASDCWTLANPMEVLVYYKFMVMIIMGT